MLNVVIALIPALVCAVIFFGFRALMLTCVSVLACVLFEYLVRKLMKRDNTIGDLSAVVTGVLVAFNVPVTLPVWMLIIGDFVAIVIAKQMFGGIGQNFANPAILARIVLLVSFPAQMTTWVAPYFNSFLVPADVVTTATPLADITNTEILPSMLDMFLGARAGSLGETAALALLIGGLYLIARRIINPITPVAYIGTVFLFTWALGLNPVYQILAGGVMLGGFFMLTDYSTSPSTRLGKLIFAVGCGIITVVIRVFGSYPEGVSFAILLMNILVPYIDKATRLKPFGKVKPAKEGKA
jgi:electron transport complex protein RnfD